MKYELDVEFVFTGKVTVKANNVYEAMDIAEKSMCASNPDITDCGDDHILDYNINLKADTFVNRQ